MASKELKEKDKVTRLFEKIPHTYVLLFFIIVAAAIMTYLIPAGTFERVEQDGRMVIVPGTFSQVEQTPVGLFDVLKSFQLGMIGASGIVFFVFMIGGSVQILRETKAIDAFLVRTVAKAKGGRSEKFVMIIITLFFALLGGVMGLYEEALAFMPFAIMIALSLGYDPIVGLSLGLLGLAGGFAAAPMNPFTVGIAQSIAELPLYSGFWYRLIFFVIVLATTLMYTFRYAKKIKADPSKSLMSDVDYDDLGLDADVEIELTTSRKLILLAFVLAIVTLLVGVMQYGWYINEMGALFFGLGIVSGILYRMKLNTMGELFVEGAKSLLYGALLIGIARGIMVVLENGQILDSVVYYLVQPLEYLPRIISASFMVIIQTFINFFVPSGSGQAMVTMPIMVPVSDILEIPRQVAVLAFQYGDGLSNMFIPTLGATMAALGMARVSYGKWISYAWKLLLIHLLIGLVAVAIATFINLGPF